MGFITLHVGLGTFKPVRSKLISHHQMHEEYFSVSENTVDLIKERGRGVVELLQLVPPRSER